MENISESSVRPLLSICIPTYNRAEYLRDSLENITSDPAFDHRVEVVISDNASTDATQDVGREYAERFPNVRYFRNDENIRDANFKLALHRAEGLYLKLSNDTLRYRPGTIAMIVSEIERTGGNTPLYFYPPIPFRPSGRYEATTPDEFLDHVSYFIGWIAGFGILRKDLDCLDVDPKYTRLQFSQVAWTMETVRKNGNAVIRFGDFYDIVTPPGKGGYNFFKVQICNLLAVLRDYGLKGWAYEREKYRIFRFHTYPVICDLLIEHQPTGFDLTDSWKTIFKEYWWRIYIYPKLLRGKIRIMKRKYRKKKQQSCQHPES